MLLEEKKRIIKLFDFALKPLLIKTNIIPTITLQYPRYSSHGDISCNIAMQISTKLKIDSYKLAKIIVKNLIQQKNYIKLIQSIEIIKPGFINLKISASIKQKTIKYILSSGVKFGQSNIGSNKKILIEFVSANPTGPLHIGHGRQCAIGDILSSLFISQGYKVTREFYYNDTGVQITNLALSVQVRAKAIFLGKSTWPDTIYNGEYITDIAKCFLAKEKIISIDGSVNIIANGKINDLKSISDFSVAYLRREQDIDLKIFGVKFDNYCLESSLYKKGKVSLVTKLLIKSGKTYYKDGALWLRTTDYGDDKDRVIRKSNGDFTYFVSDIAYHIFKWKRGFIRAINIQGYDHQGTITRVKAGLQAINIGIPNDYPNYILHKMVTVIKNGKEVKISKRSGSYITIRNLIQWLSQTESNNNSIEFTKNLIRGRDLMRFFLIYRKSDTDFLFDIDLALKKSDENPVYYIQYAHARIFSLLNQWGGDKKSLISIQDLSSLNTEKELSLLIKLSNYPKVLVNSIKDLCPHYVAFYLRDLAKELHSYYNSERILVKNITIKMARLALIYATGQVLNNGLKLIGISAPNKM
ncbi:arginine--tRNA ligase [Candidatus Profftella armatura (Diaphorina cf. continua)]|uniref:Arginine--tRNA ligase n=1 Tax=Candidatus Profftella armatura (Diaphorina cf. continua) TaxID=2661583 RepID=A0A7R7ACL2_9PROT|nr:arginine--tRNA ligase [Candidatus Profftella armatura (Diaphorina cf. continua)]BCG49519.1 arginine--tRNA ligase [Candidatus Profftella armatura (Diaphorina cf. continua)]